MRQAASRSKEKAMTVLATGAGAPLRFERSDRGELEESRVMRVKSSEHRYDLFVSDSNLDAAAAGDGVFSIPVGNLGPADAVPTVHPGSGEGWFSFAIQLPSGVQARSEDEYGFIDAAPFYCRDMTAAGWDGGGDATATGVERLDVMCYTETVTAGASLTLELPVTVTATAPATDGLVAAKDGAEVWGDEWGYPVLDADLSNNTAVLALNAADAVGVPPKLDRTGTSLTTAAGAAVALLAMGAVLFVLSGRRRAATE
jgi:hypothetical protein